MESDYIFTIFVDNFTFILVELHSKQNKEILKNASLCKMDDS